DQSTRTTINVNVNVGQEVSPDHSPQPTPKKRKLQTARRGGSNSVLPSELSHDAFHIEEPAARPRSKQTARRSAASSLSFRQNLAPAGSQSTTEAPRADAPSTQGFSASSSRSAAAPLGFINGIYKVSCPEIEGEFDDDGFTIVLTLDSPSVWGQYDFGMFSGIFHVQQRPFAASNEMFPFHWRGRENGEGAMSLGDNNVGEIFFLGNGYIEGWINVYGQCRFEGYRRDGPGTAVSNAIDIRNEWDGYNEEQYEIHGREVWSDDFNLKGLGDPIEEGFRRKKDSRVVIAGTNPGDCESNGSNSRYPNP
ncbi:MAG: hypothetical protein Q9174_007285, partial [Haloplaca sp. 1 TL-2023]